MSRRKMSASVCVTNGKLTKRVKRNEAETLVGTNGWNYCPKSEWRKSTKTVNEDTPRKKRVNSKGKKKQES